MFLEFLRIYIYIYMLGQTWDINTYAGNPEVFLQTHGIPDALIMACSQWVKNGGNISMTQATGTLSNPEDGTIYFSNAPMVDNNTHQTLDHQGGHIHIWPYNPSNNNATYTPQVLEDGVQYVPVNIKDKCTGDISILMFNNKDNMENLETFNSYLRDNAEKYSFANRQCHLKRGGKKRKKKKSLKKKKSVKKKKSLKKKTSKHRRGRMSKF